MDPHLSIEAPEEQGDAQFIRILIFLNLKPGCCSGQGPCLIQRDFNNNFAFTEFFYGESVDMVRKPSSVILCVTLVGGGGSLVLLQYFIFC